MHEHTYPESTEPAEAVEARAAAALEYEEKAKLGFRRRLASGGGDAYAEPERYQIGRDQSLGETWGSFLGAICLVFGIVAIAYKPLLMSTFALFAGVTGSIAGGSSVKTARLGLIVASAGFVIGMIYALATDRAVF